MKKAIAIFFILFFCLSQISHFLIFCAQRWQIRNMMREEILAGVPDRYLQVIEYNDNLEWEEEGKEFSWKGEFYDVVRIKKVNHKTYLYCLNDKNEEQLVRHFARYVKTSSENGKNNKHSFKSHVTDQYTINMVPALPFRPVAIQAWFNFDAALASNNREVIIPPPWNSCSQYFQI